MFDWGICRVRLTGVPSWWQPPQSLGTSIVEVREPGVLGRVMSWVPCQVLHPGASRSPAAAFRPWTLAVNCFASSPWQPPQSTGASFSG